MTNLAICSKCYALTPDTDEAVAIHRRKAHTEPAADIERARKAGSDATKALELLKATVRDFEKALDQRPVPVEPEINMRVVEAEDDEDDTTDPADEDDVSDPEAAPAVDHLTGQPITPQVDTSGLYPTQSLPRF